MRLATTDRPAVEAVERRLHQIPVAPSRDRHETLVFRVHDRERAGAQLGKLAGQQGDHRVGLVLRRARLEQVVQPVDRLHLHVALLQRDQQRRHLLVFLAGSVLRAHTIRDLPDVALDDAPIGDGVEIGHELHAPDLAALRLERKVVVLEILDVVELAEFALARRGVAERAEFPEGLAHDLVAGVAQQIDQERIDIRDDSGLTVQNQDSILRGFEQAAVPKLGLLQPDHRIEAISDASVCSGPDRQMPLANRELRFPLWLRALSGVHHGKFSALLWHREPPSGVCNLEESPDSSCESIGQTCYANRMRTHSGVVPGFLNWTSGARSGHVATVPKKVACSRRITGFSSSPSTISVRLIPVALSETMWRRTSPMAVSARAIEGLLSPSPAPTTATIARPRSTPTSPNARNWPTTESRC